MRFSLASFFLVAVPSFLPAVSAVLYGDEGYAHLDGKFWAFYSGGVGVIDPESCSIETTIALDNSGQPLPAGWSDGIYMQYFPEDSDEELKGYILINSRINRENSLGDSVSDVYVLNTKDRKVEAIIETGPRIVHSYGVHNRNEYWSHSDGDGHFYVVDLKDINSFESKVQAHASLPFHGKLLWDEDSTLGNRGFATATGEQFLFEVDIAKAELTRSYDYSSDIASGACRGLHAIAYSSVNEHVYAECSGGGGTLEFDVSDGGVKFVHQHIDQTGALYEVPDGSFVVAANKGGDKLHVFKPNGNGSRSSLAFDVSVPGHPSSPSFYPTDSTDGGADFIACLPLTGNPNKAQVDFSTGEVACDYYNQCSGPTSVNDILSGVCLHSPSSSGGPNQLTRVTEVVTDNELCSRCSDQTNFVDGTCTCTPECGSCDAEFETDLSKTGVACVDLGAVVDGTVSAATLIPNAGAVKQGSPYSSSNECTYGRTYRNHKRGQKYDASVSNFPENSIVIVDMTTKTVKCNIPVDGAPGRIVWAPNKAQAVEGVGPGSVTDPGNSGAGTYSPVLVGAMISGFAFALS